MAPPWRGPPLYGACTGLHGFLQVVARRKTSVERTAESNAPQGGSWGLVVQSRPEAPSTSYKRCPGWWQAYSTLQPHARTGTVTQRHLPGAWSSGRSAARSLDTDHRPSQGLRATRHQEGWNAGVRHTHGCHRWSRAGRAPTAGLSG